MTYRRGMGRESRERSSKSTFLDAVSPFSLPLTSSFSLLSLSLALSHPLPSSRARHSPIPPPHPFPSSSPLRLPCPYIRPPVSSLPLRPGTTAILPAPSRTILAIRTPLDISIRHLLGSGCSPRVRERNLRARRMKPVKRRSFYQYRRRRFYRAPSCCTDLSIPGTPSYQSRK